MEYEFYIDLFFLTDLMFNLMSLFLSAFFLRRSVSLRRLGVGAAIGSLWNCFLVLCPIFPMSLEIMVTVVGVGSLMTAAAFSLHSPGAVLQADAALLAASALIGGAASLFREHLWLTDWEAMALTGIVCLGGGCFFRQSMREREIGKERYPVWLYYRGQKKEFLGLADSGNRLCVPETGKPVSLIAQKDCAGFCDRVSGGFYVPYRAVGTSDGLLFAVTFEKMEIWKDGTQVVIENPVVAITKEPLSVDGAFSMLIPETYIRG